MWVFKQSFRLFGQFVRLSRHFAWLCRYLSKCLCLPCIFIRGFGQRVRCVWRNKELTTKNEYVMPGVHSRPVRSLRFSSESYTRWDCAGGTLYTLAVSSWFCCVTRGDSQARYETFWLGHCGLVKKRELMRRDTSARGYKRASKARWVFPSTFSPPCCLRFSRQKCTDSTKLITQWKHMPEMTE